MFKGMLGLPQRVASVVRVSRPPTIPRAPFQSPLTLQGFYRNPGSFAQSIVDQLVSGVIDFSSVAYLTSPVSNRKISLPSPPSVTAAFPFYTQHRRYFSRFAASEPSILDKFREGNLRFRQEFFPEGGNLETYPQGMSEEFLAARIVASQEKSSQLYKKLQNGQQPDVLIIGCVDSRVPVELVLGVEPGKALVVRNVANIVPPCEKEGGQHGVSAALQFAVKNQKIKHIIILGHHACGGMGALLGDDGLPSAEEEDFLLPWVRIASKAKARTFLEMPHASRATQIIQCGQFSLENSLENLLTFKFVREAVQTGQLSLLAWNFNFKTGAAEEIAHSETNPHRPDAVDLLYTSTRKLIKTVQLSQMPPLLG
jgi:carbonic anhydrase